MIEAAIAPAPVAKHSLTRENLATPGKYADATTANGFSKAACAALEKKAAAKAARILLA